MEGEAEMANLSLSLHFPEIFDAAALEHGLLPTVLNAVEQIEIDIIRVQAFQLLSKLGAEIRIGLKIELICQKIAVPGIFRQGFGQKGFRMAAVINVGGVEVIDSALDTAADDFPGGFEIKGLALLIFLHGQTHGPHAQPGDGKALKGLGIFHQNSS